VFDWRDFLPFAERLALEADDEPSQRTAISRAYYAAYHVAAGYVRAKNLLPVRQSHGRVWEAIGADPDAGESGMREKAERLRRRRIAADYRNPFPGDVGEQAKAAVADARDVIEALERLR
jgi:HEPN domain-containing protein